MAEMKALLSFMDAEDRLKVMRRYERSFDMAGREGEAALIRELGSPVRQVLMVEREYREREEAGLPGVADEAYVDEVQEVAAPSEEQVMEAEAAQMMESLLSDEAQEELLTQEEVYEAEETDEAAAVEYEAADEAESEPEETASDAPGAGRVAGAVALTPIMIATGVLGVVVTVALAAVAVLSGLGLGAASVYLALYAVNSMSFLPDILLVGGIAIVSLALCIFFLWLGIWLLVSGIALTIRSISAVYGKVLRKGGADNE